MHALPITSFSLVVVVLSNFILFILHSTMNNDTWTAIINPNNCNAMLQHSPKLQLFDENL